MRKLLLLMLAAGEDIADLGGLILAWMAWKDEIANIGIRVQEGPADGRGEAMPRVVTP